MVLMLVFFFQTYWSIIGDDASKLVLQVLNENRDSSDLNFMYITLIPKLPRFINPKDFRPINLCNVIMKIIAQCIANIMKLILPRLISETQSVSVLGRLMTDNALIASQNFHYMKTENRGVRILWL